MCPIRCKALENITLLRKLFIEPKNLAMNIQPNNSHNSNISLLNIQKKVASSANARMNVCLFVCRWKSQQTDLLALNLVSTMSSVYVCVCLGEMCILLLWPLITLSRDPHAYKSKLQRGCTFQRNVCSIANYVVLNNITELICCQWICMTSWFSCLKQEINTKCAQFNYALDNKTGMFVYLVENQR